MMTELGTVKDENEKLNHEKTMHDDRVREVSYNLNLSLQEKEDQVNSIQNEHEELRKEHLDLQEMSSDDRKRHSLKENEMNESLRKKEAEINLLISEKSALSIEKQDLENRVHNLRVQLESSTKTLEGKMSQPVDENIAHNFQKTRKRSCSPLKNKDRSLERQEEFETLKQQCEAQISEISFLKSQKTCFSLTNFNQSTHHLQPLNKSRSPPRSIDDSSPQFGAQIQPNRSLGSSLYSRQQSFISAEDKVQYLEQSIDRITDKRKKTKMSYDKRVKDFELIMSWIEQELQLLTQGGEVPQTHPIHQLRSSINDISEKHPNVHSWYQAILGLFSHLTSPSALKEILKALPLDSIHDTGFDVIEEREKLFACENEQQIVDFVVYCIQSHWGQETPRFSPIQGVRLEVDKIESDLSFLGLLELSSQLDPVSLKILKTVIAMLESQKSRLRDVSEGIPVRSAGPDQNTHLVTLRQLLESKPGDPVSFFYNKMHRSLSKLDKAVLADPHFTRVFNDPNILLKVLRSNIDHINASVEDQKMSFRQQEGIDRLMVNNLTSLQELMINIRNALIISDAKLLSENDANQAGFEHQLETSELLIEEIVKEIQGLREHRGQSQGLDYPETELIKQVGDQIYEILLENAKLRRNLNEMFSAVN